MYAYIYDAAKVISEISFSTDKIDDYNIKECTRTRNCATIVTYRTAHALNYKITDIKQIASSLILNERRERERERA